MRNSHRASFDREPGVNLMLTSTASPGGSSSKPSAGPRLLAALAALPMALAGKLSLPSMPLLQQHTTHSGVLIKQHQIT
jgi:hypothetical protein